MEKDYLITKYDRKAELPKVTEVLRVNLYELFDWIEKNPDAAYTVHELKCVLDLS